MSASLHHASGGDLEAVAQLIRRYWRAAQSEEGRVPGSEEGPPGLGLAELRWLARSGLRGGGLVVLRVEGAVRGVVGWRRNLSHPRSGLVLALCVEPGHWEAGAFEALLGVACRALTRAGCESVDLWLDARGSPARFAAESVGFQETEDHRLLGVLGSGEERTSLDARRLNAKRYSRPLEALGFAAEALRLVFPRFLVLLALILPFVLLALNETRSLFPLTGLGLAICVVGPSLAEVWARGRLNPARTYGLICTLVSAGLGVVWLLHAAAFDLGGPSSMKPEALLQPEAYLLGAHWAPVLLVAGVLSARSLASGEERTQAFFWGSGVFLVGLPLGSLLFLPTADSVGVLFGVFCCAVPSAWSAGALLSLAFWFADGLRDRLRLRIDLHLDPASPQPPSSSSMRP